MDSLFLGSARTRRPINLGGNSSTSQAAHLDLVQQARHEREQRERDRNRQRAARIIQAFYRGRHAAAQSRQIYRTHFDELVPAASSSSATALSTRDFVTATRYLAIGSYRLGNFQDIKRLAAWCRIALTPPASAKSDDTTPAQGPSTLTLTPAAARKRPTPLLFAPFGTSDGASWTVLTRTVARLLLSEATSAISLPQAPLFLEIVKILADPASYAKYANSASVDPVGVLLHLVQYGDSYPRLGRALRAIPAGQRTHPCLSPLLALSLLPLRSSGISAATTTPDPTLRISILVAFAHSILTVPALLAPGRLSPQQLAPFQTGNFPLWELLAALNQSSAESQQASERTEETIALLANIVEVARARVVVPPTPVSATGGGTAVKAGIENGKQSMAYLEVLRRLLGRLPKEVLHTTEAAGSTKGKEKEVEVIMLDSDDDDDEEEEEDSEVEDEDDAAGSSRLARQPRRDQDGDESMSDAADPLAPALQSRNAPPLVLDPRVRASLTHLWSREHLLALLALSTRYSASTRPALCGFLVELLVPVHTSNATTGTTPSSTAAASSPSSSSTVRDSILNTLLYSPLSAGLLRELFRGYIRSSDLGRTLASATKREKSAVVLAALKDENKYRDEWPVLVLAVEMYARSLLTMGDDEFYANSSSASATNGRNPLTLDEIVSLSGMIRNATFAMYWQDEGDAAADEHEAVNDPVAQLKTKRQAVAGMGGWSIEDVRGVMTRFLQQVHARDSRRRFTPEGHWHMTSAFDLRSFVETAVFEDERLEAEADGEPSGGGGGAGAGGAETPSQAVRAPVPPFRRGLARDTNDTRGPSRTAAYSKRQLALISPRLGVLRNIPFVVPFETRVAIFRQFVANDFRKLGLGDATSYNARSRHRALVRRTNLAEDAYTHLNGLGSELKKRIEIVFIDEHGMEESGIDGGGLFKELLTSLSKEVFDTNRGLWLATSEQELYPNPHGYAKESNQLSWFKFIGRILGKALYQGILVNVKFADFFLTKWLGRQSYLDDLASLDPELYNGLLKLKTYPGNVEEDLSLNFTITEEDFGVSRSVDLIPRGSEIAVTNENRMQYIVLVSNYRLNVQIAPQCRAFYSGLFEIINPRWLRMFNQSELAILVGGTEEAIDVDDLRRNTVYSGWSAEENTPTVRYFWDAVSSFSKDERAKLVRFVTSCERPPLLGFSQLNPLFAIRNAGTDESRLPTSATCVNLLKLPEYSDPENLRQKLLYAINSGAGFDLS
ncbi:hypothetical protein JCM10908_007082 [Rhodotorula pacifica]|uniref:ubiquitin-ubiquitin ligase HUL5 n=1 Tax=Rhodotorula pacifica TaxID=1495444 RepID=UPI00316D6B7E